MSNTEPRFWAKVDKGGPVPSHAPDLGSCWEWTAATQSHGYGVFHPIKGTTVRAHRYSLELHLGRKLIDGSLACHRCDNPKCVRPTHLYEGTPQSNVADAVARNRHKRGSMGRGAKLSDAQVIELRHRAHEGEKNRKLAEEFGIQESLVSMITSGKRWAHIGGPISTKYKKEAA